MTTPFSVRDQRIAQQLPYQANSDLIYYNLLVLLVQVRFYNKDAF